MACCVRGQSAFTRWLQRALQRIVLAPDPCVKVAGVSASAMLFRAPDGRPVIAIDKRGFIGARGIRAGEIEETIPRILPAAPSPALSDSETPVLVQA